MSFNRSVVVWCLSFCDGWGVCMPGRWPGCVRRGGVVRVSRFSGRVAARDPGRDGFGALAGEGVFVRRLRNPRRTRAGVRRSGWTGSSQGGRRSVVSGRARRSWVCTVITTSQVQRSAASGARSLGTVPPRVCLNSRKVCSMSERRKNACQQRSTSASGAPVSGHHRWAGDQPAAG